MKDFDACTRKYIIFVKDSGICTRKYIKLTSFSYKKGVHGKDWLYFFMLYENSVRFFNEK